MSQYLNELAEELESQSRIEYVEPVTANSGRIKMLEVRGRDSDMPFTLMQKINNDERLGIYNIYAMGEMETDEDDEESWIPHPIIVLTENKDE